MKDKYNNEHDKKELIISIKQLKIVRDEISW